MGWLLLLVPAAIGLGLAQVADRPAPSRARRAFVAFGWGMLAFPAALLAQLALLGGHGPVELGLPLGIAAVLLVVGPSEEFLKAAFVHRFCRPAGGFASPRASLLAGLGAAGGYPFLEHFGRFVDPSTPLFVMAGKATLGVALHLTLAPFWSQRMVSDSSVGWAPAALCAGLVHGLYNAGSFMPAWTGAPLWTAYATQFAIVGALVTRFGREWRSLPPPANQELVPCASSPSI